MNFSKFQNSNFSEAHCEGALLNFANFERSQFYGTHFDGTNLHCARFEGAYLIDTEISDSTRLYLAYFDDKTEFAHAWEAFSEIEKRAAREPWIARDMRHVDSIRKKQNPFFDPADLAAASANPPAHD